MNKKERMEINAQEKRLRQIVDNHKLDNGTMMWDDNAASEAALRMFQKELSQIKPYTTVPDYTASNCDVGFGMYFLLLLRAQRGFISKWYGITCDELYKLLDLHIVLDERIQKNVLSLLRAYLKDDENETVV